MDSPIKKAFLLLAAFVTATVLIPSLMPTLLKNDTTIHKHEQRPGKNVRQQHQQPKRNLQESLKRSREAAKAKDDEALRARIAQNRVWDWDYHKLYPVNCTAIFQGDEEAVEESDRFLRHDGKRVRMIPVPSDDQVSTWFQNCSAFKHNRGYPLRPLSEEEETFPIAYSIVTYKTSAQVERLLRSIYQPQNVYCVHIDKDSSMAFKNAIQQLVSCFHNIFIASRLESVQWGAFSALRADLNCMDDLLRRPERWKYALNLCGQDFPLKTNLEIVRQLRAFNGHNCVESFIDTRFPNRTKYSNVTGELKAPAPHNITVYKGDTYMAATRGFADFFINNPVSKDHLEWLKDTQVPDECFTSTLNKLPDAPGGNPYLGLECNVRFRRWTHRFKFPERPKCIGKAVHRLCIFSAGYLKHFYHSSHLFVNKFHYDYDPITMQCIQDLLDYRTVHTQEYNAWEEYNYHFPVTNFTWQNYSSKTYVPGLPSADLKPWRVPEIVTSNVPGGTDH